jgi:2-oxoisovalerate dehydrogenase E1 component
MNMAPAVSELRALDYPNIRRVQPADDSSDGYDGRALAMQLLQLETIRRFEQWLVEHESLVHGPLHASIGQEAVAVGAATALRPSDKITSTHRAHHHVLAKVMSFYAPPGYDPRDGGASPDALADCVRRTLAEILGLATGWAGGRGGSMHLCDLPSGVAGTTAIVGGGVPVASGIAFAEKLRQTGGVALTFVGDGASSIGGFHEGISMARVWNLPAIFLVENNLYSVATTVLETVGFEDIVIRAAGQNMLGLVVDGMDVRAVEHAVELARAHAVAGDGPVLIEAKTYRYLHQQGSLPGSRYSYRTKAEEEEWLARDPLHTFAAWLREEEVLDDAAIEQVRSRAADLVEQATLACTDVSGETVSIRSELWPHAADAVRGVRGDTSELPPVTIPEPDAQAVGEELAFSVVISRVLARTLERDPEAFILGEEVSHLRGGAYGTTRDALAAFPNRVLSTPIAENGFSGVGLGAALVGLHPIVEVMFPDFALEGADQLLNHIPKARHMYGGDLAVPLVVRTRTAQGRGFGPQHSSDPAGLFALFPGWRIVAPSTPAEYVGLFNAAMLCNDPVLVIEHHRLWPFKGRVPSGDLDYVLVPNQARRARAGTNVTVLTWSEPLHRVLALAEELVGEGVDADVIDLRWLDRASLDTGMILESAKRTGAIVIVEDTVRSHSIGVQIADEVVDAVDPFLRRPIARVTGKDVHPPVSKPLEEAVLLQDDDIRRALVELAHAPARRGLGG